MTALSQLVNTLSQGYMTAQALTIFMLFAVGFLFVRAVWAGEDDHGIWLVLLAFPAGLAVFSTASYLMLCLGIPFNTYAVAVVLALVAITCFGVSIRKRRDVYIRNGKTRDILILSAVVLAAVLAFMLTSNIFKVVLDNDSFFYFSAYPEAIVREGAYIKYFDVFLTDSAPIGSIIQTLPYLFGFSETFGIQFFMDVNFLLIFAYALYSELSGAMGKREAALCASAVSLFLITSSAWITTAKWVMAGVYFMSYYFITVYLGYRAAFMQRKPFALMALFAASTAMMRHEGVVFVIIAVLTLSFLSEYSGRELALCFICPVTVAALLYYIRVFLILGVHPLYAFLTPAKALVMTGALLLSGIYLLVIRNRLKEGIRSLLPVLLPAVLLLFNIALLVARPAEYLGNLKMFYLNVRIGAGWGWFGYIAGAVFIALLIKAVLKKERYLLLFDSLMISYVFGVLLVAFGRGDALRKGVGDSGNRVMLTAVPLIVFALVLRWFPEAVAGKEGYATGKECEREPLSTEDRGVSGEEEDDGIEG